MVPIGNLIMMAVNALLGIAIPIFLCWWAVKKHQANLSTILIGAGWPVFSRKPAASWL